MDENLQRLVDELRNEVCPQRVHDEVARRISAQALPARPFRYAFSMTTVIVFVVCGLVVWLWPETHHTNSRAQLASPAKPNPAQVVAQAEGALGYVGNALLSAGVRSERALSKQAVPPLRNHLGSTTDKIIQLLKQ